MILIGIITKNVQKVRKMNNEKRSALLQRWVCQIFNYKDRPDLTKLSVSLLDRLRK